MHNNPNAKCESHVPMACGVLYHNFPKQDGHDVHNVATHVKATPRFVAMCVVVVVAQNVALFGSCTACCSTSPLITCG